MKNTTLVERKSDREVVVTRLINASPAVVWKVFTRAELFRQWWIPKSVPLKLLSCEMDVRVGGGYRLVFAYEGAEMAFFGTYREVIPESRLVWSNDEAGDGGQLSTVSFEAQSGKTLVVMHELYPSKEALEASGSHDALPETFEQLEEFVIGR
jgi:uncharacterized protein YndB with AHSA1/START domain